MNRWSGLAMAWTFALAFSPAVVGQDSTGDFRPPPPPEQPIAFSHKTHVSQGLGCVACHTTATAGDRATIPPTSMCMGCHASVRPDSAEVQKLAGYHARQEDVPWRRVYRLPSFVYFSHRVHLPAAGSTSCETCHGDVRELNAMQKLKDTAMATCVACHTAQSAPTRCDSCHDTR
jgi:hypothetical protein